MIVLLALAAVASVALTVSTRSSTDISVTSNIEDAQRAFTAAEAGIEEVLLDPHTALISGGPETHIVGSAGASVSTDVNAIPENLQAYAYPFQLSKGDVATLWFMSHDADNQLTCSGSGCYTGNHIRICWGSPGVNATNVGALEITVYNRNASGQIVAKRTTVDGDSSRKATNRFTHSPSGTCNPIDGQQYAFSRDINFATDLGITNASTAGNLLMMRVRLLYNDSSQPIGFVTEGAGNLPIQGLKVDARGLSGTSQRRLEAFSLYPVVPSMFEAALFSPPGVTKN